MQPVLLEVSGMKCGGCSAAVKRILLSQPGSVSAASVNLVTESAAVTFSSAAVAGTSPEALAQQAAEALTQKVGIAHACLCASQCMVGKIMPMCMSS